MNAVLPEGTADVSGGFDQYRLPPSVDGAPLDFGHLRQAFGDALMHAARAGGGQKWCFGDAVDEIECCLTAAQAQKARRARLVQARRSTP